MTTTWPRFPLIYEVNTWVWLNELSKRYGQSIALGNVPPEEWDRLLGHHADAVWLMGVWERSPAGIAVALANRALTEEFQRVLPDYTEADVVGSPYCVRRYQVAKELGGAEGLARGRAELASRGLRLVLDFVPNHVAPDHDWVRDHPEYFIQGTRDDLAAKPDEFLESNGSVIARGRDPFFPPWPDVVQLNAFSPQLRAAALETLVSIGSQCDGLRCDMAMLMMNPVFEETWGERAGTSPGTEFWPELLSAVRAVHPNVLFIAEAYWDLEWELQQQGFDFCYDKRLYDRLVRDGGASVRGHLTADAEFQRRLIRFIENHDEPRAASTFDGSKARVAAVTALTLPGARILHQGQPQGRTVRLPVFLRRAPEEEVDEDLHCFYRQLLAAVSDPILSEGEWTLCEQYGWDGNDRYQEIVAWAWEQDDARLLVVVNLSDQPAAARVRLPWAGPWDVDWRLIDPLQNDRFERGGSELQAAGLYVALPGWGFHFLQCAPRAPEVRSRVAPRTERGAGG
jgi:hypothetical protein